MKKVVVVGSGPAGLAAAERLASAGVAVRLYTLGHHLGGKACSWRSPDGRVLEHGQHVVLGFYDEMRALLRRSGVDHKESTVSNRGRFTIFEERDQKVYQLQLGSSTLGTLVKGLAYDGITPAEKSAFAAFMARVAPRIVAAGVPESLDDVCLTAWALERGFPISMTHSTLFRASREAQLNWPGEISAYNMLKTIRTAGRDYQTAEACLPAGGMSEIFWEPIAKRIVDLGGEVIRYSKLVGLRHEEGRLTGLVFERPIPHIPGQRYIEGSIPTDPTSTKIVEDFDAAILTLPGPALAEVLATDPVLNDMPGLSGVQHITSVAPLGLHVWHRNANTAKYQTVVAGLAPPLGFVVDNKPIYTEFRDDDRYGACLHFVGQETCFEDDDDETLLQRCLDSIQKVDGFECMDRQGVLHFEVVRNRSPHKRYWNPEPGSHKNKPEPETPVQGLFLAGDWIRSKLDFPCMENAVRSGRQAARLAMKQIDKRRAA